MESIKENHIKRYFTNIDFRSDAWSVSTFKSDLKSVLGEEPAIEVIYKKDVMINESGEAREIEKIEKLNVIFYDLDNKFKKIEFVL
jgi:hypothetical protein